MKNLKTIAKLKKAIRNVKTDPSRTNSSLRSVFFSGDLFTIQIMDPGHGNFFYFICM